MMQHSLRREDGRGRSGPARLSSRRRAREGGQGRVGERATTTGSRRGGEEVVTWGGRLRLRRVRLGRGETTAGRRRVATKVDAELERLGLRQESGGPPAWGDGCFFVEGKLNGEDGVASNRAEGRATKRSRPAHEPPSASSLLRRAEAESLVSIRRSHWRTHPTFEHVLEPPTIVGIGRPARGRIVEAFNLDFLRHRRRLLAESRAFEHAAASVTGGADGRALARSEKDEEVHGLWGEFGDDQSGSVRRERGAPRTIKRFVTGILCV